MNNELTTEQIIDRGLDASSLLSNQTFQGVIRSLGVECFAAFTETKPEDTTARESAYNLYQGLKAIEAELKARVQAQEEAVRQIDAEHDEQDQSDLDGPIHIKGDIDL